jgi:hypothetical protein
MQIYGIDFTSAPSRKKPITVAECVFIKQKLTVLSIQNLTDFFQFEGLLGSTKTPWVMAIDFPFSMPKFWLEAMNWPTSWAESVQFISNMTLPEFVHCIKLYRDSQPKGHKHHFRPIDRAAKGQSPMMVHYTPVGRMFYQGAPRLLKSNASIFPFMKRSPEHVIVEGYPALIARRYCGSSSYKTDSPKKKTPHQLNAQEKARHDIIAGIASAAFKHEFNFEVNWAQGFNTNQLVADDTGDQLDALLSAVQSAWAYTQHEHHYGIPSLAKFGSAEGWVPDPGLWIPTIA